MQASKKSQYNEQYAERAIEEFQGFKASFPGDKQSLEADESIKILRTKKAKTSFETGLFYEKRGKFKSARVYYEEVVSKYPETTFAEQSRKKVDEMVRMENEPERGSIFPKLPKVKMPKLW